MQQKRTVIMAALAFVLNVAIVIWVASMVRAAGHSVTHWAIAVVALVLALDYFTVKALRWAVAATIRRQDKRREQQLIDQARAKLMKDLGGISPGMAQAIAKAKITIVDRDELSGFAECQDHIDYVAGLPSLDEAHAEHTRAVLN